MMAYTVVPLSRCALPSVFTRHAESGCLRLFLSLQCAAPFEGLYLRLVVHENIENNLKRAWTRSLSDSVLWANWRSQETLLFLRCALAPLRKRS